MLSISVTEFEHQLQAILHRAETGEQVVLTRTGRAIAQIMPMPKQNDKSYQTLPFSELAKFRATQTRSDYASWENLKANRQHYQRLDKELNHV